VRAQLTKESSMKRLTTVVVMMLAVASGTAVTLATGARVMSQAQEAGASIAQEGQKAQGEGTAPAQATGGTGADHDGAELFRTWCASCHGLSGTGNGPLAGQLRRRVPDLTRIAEKNGGLFPVARIHRIIDGRDVGAHGNPDMPIWGNAFKAVKDGHSDASVRARIEAIVRYLESIQRRNA
jgi:cytochrome c5